MKITFMMKLAPVFLILLMGCNRGSTGNSGPTLEQLMSQPPGAPSDLTVAAASHEIIFLKWLDHSFNEDGFVIERSLDGANFTPIYTVPPDTVNYYDIKLTPHTEYHYRLYATNAFGDSDYSNVDMDKTDKLTWASSYGGALEDRVNAVCATGDGGCVMAGSTDSFGMSSEDFWVIRLDNQGLVEWQKTFGGLLTDRAKAVVQTKDQGFLVAGDTESFGAGETDIWVLKLSPYGEIDWQKTYGGAGPDWTASVFLRENQGYQVIGATGSYGQGFSNIWALQLQSGGGVVWQRCYGSQDAEYANAAVMDASGGYYVTGASVAGGGDPQILCLRISKTGEALWDYQYGPGLTRALMRSAQNKILVVGSNLLKPKGSEYFLLELETDGQPFRYSGFANQSPSNAFNDPYFIGPGYNGSVVIVGAEYKSAAQSRISFLNLNYLSEVLWAKSYDGGGSQVPCFIRQQPYGYLMGATKISQTSLSDYWVIRTDFNGHISFNPASGATVETQNWTRTAFLLPNIESPNLLEEITTVFPISTHAIDLDTFCTVEDQAP